MSEETRLKSKHTAVVVIALLLIICIFAGVYLMIYINNKNQEQLRASNRIDQLFDDISDVDGDEYYEFKDNYEKCLDKLAETEKLIAENHLEEKYGTKYDELSSYLNDIKILRDLEEDYYWGDPSTSKSLFEVNEELNKLTNERVIKKANDTIDLESRVREYIISKNLYDMMRTLKEKNPTYIIEEVFSCGFKKDGSTEWGIGVDDYYPDWEDFRLNMTYFEPSITNYEIIDNIKNNGEYALCVRYLNDENSNRVQYRYWNVDVKASIKQGGAFYDVTEYYSGEPTTYNDLRFDQVSSM